VILIPATGVGVANFFLACAFMGRATIGRWILAGTDPNSDFPDRLLLTRRIGIWAVLTISPAIILSFLYFAVGLGVV